MMDPVKYELFRHRLFNILEEGRIAIQMVSGSPVVVEGGETMCSFHNSDGTPILVAAGILLHCIGARDFIYEAIREYEEDPGIFEGDQLFFNNPYVGGQHPCDQVVLKPIFFGGRRIAWAASIMHTPETGAIEPGGMPVGATEIFHEGIMIHGLKIVEKGKFRNEVFRTIIEQTRDPSLVGLDTKAKIAANNVCAKGYLDLVARYGVDFVEEASAKIIADSEAMARSRLRSLPDGAWRSRLCGDDYLHRGVKSLETTARPYRVVCTMTKRGSDIAFDYTGTSPQSAGSVNSTYAATWGSLFVVLASQLFWDVPWNGGMMAPVELTAPQGTVVNCKYPAACSNGVITAGMLAMGAAHQCIAKMLYAGGCLDDVNSSWTCCAGSPHFGGVNRDGRPFGGVILDHFASGLGAAPERDGVDSGGEMMNPTSNISDAEALEINLPFLTLMRRMMPDSGGFGKHRGGTGLASAYMVYGEKPIRIGFHGGGKRCPGGFAMFGGYPTGLQERKYLIGTDILKSFERSNLPLDVESMGELNGRIVDVPPAYPSIPINKYDFIYYNMAGGGGYGDPLDRRPEAVLDDLKNGAISPETAERVYGVAFSRDDGAYRVDSEKTAELRKKIIEERLKEGRSIESTHSLGGSLK